ncbi:MAG: zinc-dependent alcohol dehydrogenase [Candidatus Baldrarchaeia archaeon]
MENETMRIANWYGGKDFRIERVPKPRIKDDGVLIRVKAVSICGTELHAYTGKSKRREEIHGLPLVMGHEFSGEVVEAGKNVKEISVGDRVAVNPLITCGKCEQCITGKTNICKKIKMIGLHVDGAFAEYVPVIGGNCYKIPDTMSFEEASLMEPCSVGLHAVNVSQIELGDDVVVIGDGPIGLMALQAAKLAGAARIFVVGHHNYRLDLAKKLGADEVINEREENAVKKVMELTDGRGVDVVLEAVGTQKAVQQGIDMANKGKTVTVIGLLEKSMELNMLNVTVKELRIQGSYGYTKKEFGSSVKLASKNKINLKQMITHIFPLEEIQKGFEILAQKKNAIKVVIKP